MTTKLSLISKKAFLFFFVLKLIHIPSLQMLELLAPMHSMAIKL